MAPGTRPGESMVPAAPTIRNAPPTWEVAYSAAAITYLVGRSSDQQQARSATASPCSSVLSGLPGEDVGEWV